MHLTPFHITGDFNISDSTSSNTSDPCSYFFSSCLFFFGLHFTTIPRFDWKRYQMVFASIIWRHTAAVVHFKNNVVIKLVLRALHKNNIFSPATAFSFTRKCLFKKVILTSLSLPFADDRRSDFTECSRSHSCDLSAHDLEERMLFIINNQPYC